MKKVFLNVALMAALLAGGMSMTSCGEEEGEGEIGGLGEYVDCTGLKAIASVENGGSITIEGTVKSSSKIQEFGLYKTTIEVNNKGKEKVKGELAIDMLKGEVKTKSDEGKSFDAEITPTKVSIADAVDYTLYIKNRGDKAQQYDLAYPYTDLECGGAKCLTKGSYVSITKGKVYMMKDLFDGNSADGYTLKEDAPIADVECIVENGKLVPTSRANGVIKNYLDKCTGSYVENGVIVTANGTIGNVNFEVVDAEATEYKISGQRITSKNFEVDVKGFTFSK